MQAQLRGQYRVRTGLDVWDEVEPAMLLPFNRPPLFDAGLNWRAERVTPRYLETSPDLVLQGRIHDEAIR